MKFSLIMLILLASLPLQASQVVKKDWITSMKTALPTALCNGEGYFRQCFKVTAEECEQRSASATRICLSEFNSQMPDVLKQPEDGMKWGGKIGECVGNAYEISLKARKLSTKKCESPDAWY